MGEALLTGRRFLIELRRFQRRFLARGLAPDVETAGLSIPRGNGKSTLAAYILERCMTPGDKLHVAGSEYLLLSGSLDQARQVFRPFRAALEELAPGDYRFTDSKTQIGARHKPSGTTLRVMSSNAKTAFGIVGTPLVVCDEPGAWETIGGQLMADALETAQGKPDSSLRVLYIGTLAPSTGGWWHDLINAGSGPGVHVTKLQGDPETWDSWHTIRKANPLTAVSPEFRRKLLTERDAARLDTRLKARFLSYRLNVPTADEAAMLLSVDDYERATSRELPEREGKPIVGIDLGGGRSWSAAVALWPNGRTEALALAPGIPDIEAQEKRDRVPRGTYRRLVDMGALMVAHGLHVQTPSQLVDAMLDAWGRPRFAVCDRFRLADLKDASRSVKLVPRVTRWSEAAEDIRALRRMAKDGPLAVAHSAELLLGASLAVATVKNDDAGNVRLVKRSKNNDARDDVAAALTLAAGAVSRLPKKRGSFYRGLT